MILEICANSLESAINAENGGADRIELCTNLKVGGLTPPKELIKSAIDSLSIPIFALIRPREGNFIYSQNELSLILDQIELCKNYGCQGIVSGLLTEQKEIDLDNTYKLIEAARPLSFTFHRAFDVVNDIENALKNLIQLGADRVLTSAKHKSAADGLETLIKLKKIAGKNLIIMPGGGVRSTNAEMFKINGFKELHSSALINNDSSLNNIIAYDTVNTAYNQISNLKEIKKIKSICSN